MKWGVIYYFSLLFYNSYSAILFVLNRVLTFGSFRLEQVCYALRCSGRHACYNGYFNEYRTYIEKYG